MMYTILLPFTIFEVNLEYTFACGEKYSSKLYISRSLVTIFASMKLDVLICTIDERIALVPAILLPMRADVNYIVSMQYTDEAYLQQIPQVLRERADVKVVTLKGKGLTRNRNFALKHATADIALIADDDVRYCDEYFNRIITTYKQHPHLDVAQFKIKSLDGGFIKNYPDYSYTYPHIAKGMYVSSQEITLRVATVRGKVHFDERFGLGSPYFICGEEEIFFYDAYRAGFTVSYFPYFAVEHPSESTGVHTYTDERVMMAKGAMHYRLHGASAWLRMFKFALTSAIARKGRFGILLRNTFKGINYYRKVVRYESSIGR